MVVEPHSWLEVVHAKLRRFAFEKIADLGFGRPRPPFCKPAPHSVITGNLVSLPCAARALTVCSVLATGQVATVRLFWLLLDSACHADGWSTPCLTLLQDSVSAHVFITAVNPCGLSIQLVAEGSLS